MSIDIEKTTQLCKKYHQAEMEECLRVADDVCQKKFLFTLRWDMERTVTPVQFDGEIDWTYKPGDDLEWTVMLSRHRYTVCLAQAYAITGLQKYLNAFVDTVSSFINNVPLAGSEGKNTWRTIDSGIRASNWIWSLHILQEATALPENFLETVRGSLAEHINYLVERYNDTLFMSNWGVLANTGALAACFYLQNGGYGDFEDKIALLLERLEEQIEIQVLPDGWQWEQSPMYHHEVLWCYLEDILLLRENGREIPKAIWNKTLSMCHATLKSTKPNHHQLMRCDSDDTDVRDILTLGAFVFGDSEIRFGAYDRPDFDNLWRLGASGDESYQKLAGKAPHSCSSAMESSGNYLWRSSWQEDATMLAFKCGPLSSGHGHADLLHFDLFAGGEDILVDSGRYTYVNNESRRYLKSQWAHNTLTIDQKPFTDCSASWGYGAVAKAVKGLCADVGDYYYLSGGHLGYIEDGLFVRRQIIAIKPDIFVICDIVYGSGKHSCLQKFHFNNKGKLTLEKDGSALYLSEKNKAHLAVLGDRATVTVKPSQISRSYNTIEDSHCIEAEYDLSINCPMVTVVGLGDGADFTMEKLPVFQVREKRLLDDSCAVALKLTAGERRYVIICSMNHPAGNINLLGADGERGYGETMIFDSQHRRTVLSY